jgi:acyl carrier protein
LAAIEGKEYMKAEEIRAAILEVVSEIVPDEDVSNLKGDIRIRDQIEMDSMDFLDVVMELRKRYGVIVPEDDYMELSTLDGSVAYLEPKMKDI